MKKIRKGVFEINSSSCHSISIDNTSLEFEKVNLDENGIFYIYSNDFGWEQEDYSHYSDKCSYLAIYIRDWCGEREQEFRSIFEQCIKDYTQCSEIVYEDLVWDTELATYNHHQTGEECSYMRKLGNSYIDHQSVEDQDYHYLFDKNNPEYVEGELKNFLFNPNSTLTTDNDNRSDYNDWMSW